MKNENAKQEIAQKIADSIIEKEQDLANVLNGFFQKKKSVRNAIVIVAFILFLILNLLSFKYL